MEKGITSSSEQLQSVNKNGSVNEKNESVKVVGEDNEVVPSKKGLEQSAEDSTKKFSTLKSGKFGSSNRFEILNFPLACDDGGMEKNVMVTRQARAAFVGVADLMKSLKPKKKSQVEKGKNKAGTSSERPLILT
ncbi:hypothetical protein DITRI_Ditri11bG0127200 [Diplodiscus trichospermus]